MDDPVSVFVDVRIMRHDDDATILMRDILLDEGDDHPSCVAVERRGGFVENQDLRTVHDRTRDRHTLLFVP
jgi:hypothetical protein